MIDEGSLTVGALAKASGLTVRTLHHWDALGLLVPAGRSASGYRRLRPGRGRAAVPDRLVRILDVLDADAEPSLDQLIDTIEVMTLHERYYTPEQLQQLSERADALGEEGMRKAEQDWADLIAEVEAERAKGSDPGAPRMQELAGRWRALIGQFTGGDPGIAASLKRMYESEGPEKASRGALSPELMAYAGEAVRLRSAAG